MELLREATFEDTWETKGLSTAAAKRKEALDATFSGRLAHSVSDSVSGSVSGSVPGSTDDSTPGGDATKDSTPEKKTDNYRMYSLDDSLGILDHNTDFLLRHCFKVEL